jgi:hypothetical protein
MRRPSNRRAASRLAGGRHLNRKMDDLLTRAGFRIDKLANP